MQPRPGAGLAALGTPLPAGPGCSRLGYFYRPPAVAIWPSVATGTAAAAEAAGGGSLGRDPPSPPGQREQLCRALSGLVSTAGAPSWALWPDTEVPILTQAVLSPLSLLSLPVPSLCSAPSPGMGWGAEERSCGMHGQWVRDIAGHPHAAKPRCPPTGDTRTWAGSPAPPECEMRGHKELRVLSPRLGPALVPPVQRRGGSTSSVPGGCPGCVGPSHSLGDIKPPRDSVSKGVQSGDEGEGGAGRGSERY